MTDPRAEQPVVLQWGRVKVHAHETGDGRWFWWACDYTDSAIVDLGHGYEESYEAALQAAEQLRPASGD